MQLKGLFEKCGRAIAARSKFILILTGLLVTAAVIISMRLGVDTDITRMLPQSNASAKSMTEITKEFDSTSTLIAVIEGPTRDALIAAGSDFAKRIAGDERTAPLVRSTRLKLDRAFVEKWGLLLQKNDELTDMKEILSQASLLPMLRKTNDLIEEKLSDGDDEEVEGSEGEDSSYALMSQFGLFASQLNEALTRDESESAGETLADTWLFGEEYMFDPEGKTLLLVVRPNFAIGDRKKLVALTDGASNIAKEISASMDGVSFRFAGDIQSEADEERAIGSDVFYPSLIAVAIIGALFFFSFNRRRSIVFPIIALAAGIILDLAIAALTVKNLNMITSSFGALLVGLGIDFGIHIVSRFDDATQRGKSAAEALGETFGEIASPVIIGGLTTALAFYALMFSNTIAFRQFGLIAGTGILTTLFASFTVLPALLAQFPGKGNRTVQRRILTFGAARKVTGFSMKRPKTVVLIAIALTAVAAVSIPRNSFDYDMRNIGPQNTDAKETERIIADRYGISTWQHLAIADSVEEARSLAKRCEDAPLVRRVQSIADYIPESAEQDATLSVIAEIRDQDDRLRAVEWDGESVTEFSGELERLEWNMIELGDLAAASLGESAMPVRKRNAMIREVYGSETGQAGEEVFARLRETIERIGPNEAAARLSAIDSSFARSIDSKVKALTAVDRHITLDDLSEDIKIDLVNGNGSKYLVIIEPNAMLAGENAFIRFTEGLKTVSEDVTGTLTLGYELSREILTESEKMGGIIALLVMLVVFLGMGKIGPTLFCMGSFLAAFAWLFGLSPLSGKFNIVNALSIPLIMGIGIDYCVHIMSALMERDNREDSLMKTIRSVTLSMLTTLIGFGSLALIGKFKGIADLGRTLSIGIVCSYVAALVLIPALWSLGKVRRKRILAATLILLTMGLGAQSAQGAESAESIIRRLDEKNSEVTSKMAMTMTVTPADGGAPREFSVTAFENTKGESMIEFTAPKTVKGMKILSRDSSSWVFFPSTGRVRKLGGSAKGGSVQGVGGDFSYDDLGSGSWNEDYTFSILEDASGHWILEGKRKNADAGYDAVRLTVEKKTYRMTSGEFALEKEGGYFKRLEVTDFRNFGTFERGTHLLMTNSKKGSSTLVRITAGDFGISIPESTFDPARFYQ